MDAKRTLLDQLLPMMEQNGVEPGLLRAMREPVWLEAVTMENLQFLLQRHLALQELRQQNAGLYDRWQQSKQH